MWMSPEALVSWMPKHASKRGGQLKDSDAAIQTALTLRLVFHLPLRQAEDFMNSLFAIMGIGLPVPGHTTLSRRGQHLDDLARPASVATVR